jgi:hypothetical protein
VGTETSSRGYIDGDQDEVKIDGTVLEREEMHEWPTSGEGMRRERGEP